MLTAMSTVPAFADPLLPLPGAAGWAVVDVETSGLRPHQHRVLSVAVLTLDRAGNLLEEYSTLQAQAGSPVPARRPVAVGVIVVGHHTAGPEDASSHARQALRVDLGRLGDMPAPELARLPDQAQGTVELDSGLAQGDDVPVDGAQEPAATANGRDTLERDTAGGAVVIADLVAPLDTDMVRLQPLISYWPSLTWSGIGSAGTMATFS
jgi:hypothetical protein